MYRLRVARHMMQMPPPPDHPARDHYGLFVTWQQCLFGFFQLVAWIGTAVISRRIVTRNLGSIPREGPVIITSNHLSHFDTILVGQFVPRPFFAMTKYELFQNRNLGLFLRSLGGFPVKRGEPNRESLQWIINTVKGGEELFIFPEGTRSKDYTIQPGKAGVAMIARLADAPIVPIAVTGTDGLMRRPRWGIFTRPQMTITAGQPYYLRDLVPDVKRADLEDLSDLIMLKIADLLPPDYRGDFSADYVQTRRTERQETRQHAAETRAANRSHHRGSAKPPIGDRGIEIGWRKSLGFRSPMRRRLLCQPIRRTILRQRSGGSPRAPTAKSENPRVIRGRLKNYER